MAKLDSLQKQIIESVKRNVKKDLIYEPSSKVFIGSDKYGTSVEDHTWECLQFEMARYERHLNSNDKKVLENYIKEWIAKIYQTCIV